VVDEGGAEEARGLPYISIRQHTSAYVSIRRRGRGGRSSRPGGCRA
jgi:hypothetical protein